MPSTSVASRRWMIFMAQWLGVLESWRSERNMSCARGDLRHLVTQLQCWRAAAQATFRRGPGPQSTACKQPVVDKQAQKGAKCGNIQSNCRRS